MCTQEQLLFAYQKGKVLTQKWMQCCKSFFHTSFHQKIGAIQDSESFRTEIIHTWQKHPAYIIGFIVQKRDKKRVCHHAFWPQNSIFLRELSFAAFQWNAEGLVIFSSLSLYSVISWNCMWFASEFVIKVIVIFTNFLSISQLKVNFLHPHFSPVSRQTFFYSKHFCIFI